MRTRFTEEARQEYLAQIAYYAATDKDVADRFIRAVESASALIEAYPYAGAPVQLNARRVLVRRFPFSIVYRPEETEIVVFAVAHRSRRPGYWTYRLED
ncbi:MAG: type II toxin-antitoxin system RelE/ParE family toxin [Chloroflexota bacterium]